MILCFLDYNDMSAVYANDLREEAIRVAAAEVGYHEKETLDNLYDHTANAGDKNYTKYAVDLCQAYGQPWGATFFWWVMMQAGVPRQAFPNDNAATTDWFRERGLWHDREGYTPQPGDYAVLGNVANCGIVESVTEDRVYIIAGNRGDTNAVTRFDVTFDDTYIKGYGNIDYDYVYQPTGLDFGESFCAVISKTESLKPLRNYEDKPVLWSELLRADYRWLFRKQDDGTYMIQSLYDGRVLEVKDSGAARDVQIIMSDIKTENNDHQKWYICSNGVGYRLISKNATNFCMNVYGDYNTDGAHMLLWQHHDGNSQKFSFTQIEYIGLTGITIDSDYNKTMKVNESQILEYALTPETASADMVSWVSSDNSIAEVSEDGIVKAKKEGMVTILCKSTYDNTISDKIIIQVKSEKNEQEETTTEQQVTTEKTEVTTEVMTENTEETVQPETAADQENVDTVRKGTKIEGKQCWFEITSVKKNTAKVIGISNVKAASVKIPATVKYMDKTYKVTSIGKNAFKNNSKIKTVIIGKNIESIQERAFYGCKKLKTIKIQSTKLKKIGVNAFKKIDKNPVIYAPKGKIDEYQKLIKGKI